MRGRHQLATEGLRMDRVPMIDLQPLRDGTPDGLAHVAAQIGAAARDIGFFAVRNHGIPRAAIDAEIPLIVCITEGIPVADMVKVKRSLSGSKSRLIGPNCPGVMTSGECKIGIMPGNIFSQRQRWVSFRAPERLPMRRCSRRPARASARRPPSASAAIPSRGRNSSICWSCFSATTATTSIIMIGEIGGSAEEDAAQFIADEAKRGRKKPTVGFIAGRTAPPGRRMGHAGAIIAGGKGGAEDKIAAMEAAGITVSPSPARLGKTLVEVLKG